MEKIIEYRGLKCSWNYNKHEGFYYGKVHGLIDLVTYESGINNPEETIKEAIEDYLDTVIELRKK